MGGFKKQEILSLSFLATLFFLKMPETRALFIIFNVVFVGQVLAVEPLDLDFLALLLLILVSSPLTPRPRINDFLYCSTSASAVADGADNEERKMTIRDRNN